ncbi:MAG: alpha/beta fold hydrolase, partial [Bacteroidetes bacterium]|nr:alpha/beta fold hydrolase [Bacteroidota bacterium]
MILTLLLMSLLSPLPDSTEATLPYYPEPIDTTTVGDHDVAYYDAGTGEETVLFVHGLGSNLSFWRHNLDAFTDDYRVLALDLPGYGLSDKDDVPGTMAFYADVLSGFLDTLDVAQVHLVGVSMGGQIAMTFALDHPERLGKLVLVSPAGIETFTDEEGLALRMATTPEALQNTPPEQYRMNVALNFDTFDENRHGWIIEQRQALEQRADFPDYAAANARSVAGMLDGPVLDRLDALQTPTLVLFGAGDKLIPNRFLHGDLTTADIAETARTALPNATVEMVDDAGHVLMIERPEAFNARVRT